MNVNLIFQLAFYSNFLPRYVFELTMCMSEIKLVSWMSTLSKAWSASFKFLFSFIFKMTEFFQYYKARVVEMIFIWNYICMQYFHEMTKLFAMFWLIYNAANIVNLWQFLFVLSDNKIAPLKGLTISAQTMVVSRDRWTFYH